MENEIGEQVEVEPETEGKKNIKIEIENKETK
jgi:hypothetical protein